MKSRRSCNEFYLFINIGCLVFFIERRFEISIDLQSISIVSKMTSLSTSFDTFSLKLGLVMSPLDKIISSISTKPLLKGQTTIISWYSHSNNTTIAHFRRSSSVDLFLLTSDDNWPEGAGGMVMAGKDFGKRGRGYDNGGEVLCGGGTSRASILVRDVVT